MSTIEDVTTRLLDNLANLGLKQSYMIVPAKGIGYAMVHDYWMDLAKAGRLKYRWCDMKPEDVYPHELALYTIDTAHCYFIIDVVSRELVGEFALAHFTGKAAQMHFSAHPDNHPLFSAELARQVSDTIINHWKSVVNMDESFVDTLFGLTPKDNRAACVFLRKAGFKPMGTLVSGAKFEGNTTDALMSTKTRIN